MILNSNLYYKKMDIDDEKSNDSFQGEIDLVNEEEEENRLSQKERLNKILETIKQTNNNPENDSGEKPQVLRAKPNAGKTNDKTEDKDKVPEPFDPNFNLNEKYFFQNININEWKDINDFIERFINEDNLGEKDLEEYFKDHPKILKGNVLKLQSTVEEKFSEKKDLKKYKILTNFLIKNYFKPKPIICECYFFPNPSNEQRVVNMFRTCKKTLDIAIFTFTRDSIAQAILDAHQRGLKVRCIGDDGNSKVKGSDVRLLASVGIPCKTDNNTRFHMHNKMAIIDNSVVITGSFNWTNQAINKNQDNILFIEDKNIANQYTDYFNKIWDSFDTVITKEEAKKYLEEEKKAQEKKDEGKEKDNKKETAKKETAKKETTKKETTKKETTKKETAKKETAKKETAKKETTKKETTKKETAKKETAKKETAKKETTKKETTKKDTTKKETAKKETAKKETAKKETTKKETAKKETTKKETTKKKETTTKKKETERNKTMKEKKKSSSAKEKGKTSKAKSDKPKAKTTKEKKMEKVNKKKTKETKRVRGVKSTKSTKTAKSNKSTSKKK